MKLSSRIPNKHCRTHAGVCCCVYLTSAQMYNLCCCSKVQSWNMWCMFATLLLAKLFAAMLYSFIIEICVFVMLLICVCCLFGAHTKKCFYFWLVEMNAFFGLANAFLNLSLTEIRTFRCSSQFACYYWPNTRQCRLRANTHSMPLGVCTL